MSAFIIAANRVWKRPALKRASLQIWIEGQSPMYRWVFPLEPHQISPLSLYLVPPVAWIRQPQFPNTPISLKQQILRVSEKWMARKECLIFHVIKKAPRITIKWFMQFYTLITSTEGYWDIIRQVSAEMLCFWPLKSRREIFKLLRTIVIFDEHPWRSRQHEHLQSRWSWIWYSSTHV